MDEYCNSLKVQRSGDPLEHVNLINRIFTLESLIKSDTELLSKMKLELIVAANKNR